MAERIGYLTADDTLTNRRATSTLSGLTPYALQALVLNPLAFPGGLCLYSKALLLDSLLFFDLQVR